MNDSLKEIVALARQQMKLEAEIEMAELNLARLKAQLRSIAEEGLPLAMFEVRMEKFTLDTGETVTVKKDFAIQLSNENKPTAWNWLERNGYGALIKTEVAVAFGKGGLTPAQKLQEQLAKKYAENVSLTRDVHYQTLKAFINEQTREGKPIPLDLFGASPVNKATIKAPKSKG